MKKIVFALLMTFTLESFADSWVNGYQKRDGTYVQGHYRSTANSFKNDNYSTRGNTNPYTGSYGTKPRDEDYSGYSGSRSRSRRSAWGN